jgi:hypothetical protein
MDDEETAHEWVNATVIGIGARFEWRKCKAGIGTDKPGIKGAQISKTTII